MIKLSLKILNSARIISTEDTYFLRQEVLRKGIDLPYKFEGDFDKDTFHLGVYENDKLVCIGTFMKQSIDVSLQKQYQLRGMATLPSKSGKGYGKMLLDFADKELKSRDINYLWCNARVIAVPFYEKCGFKIKGEAFDISKVGMHYKMIKLISYENN